MAKRSKERGLSFLYNRNGVSMHCGITSVSEFEILGKSDNALAPRMEEQIRVVYSLGNEFPQYDGYTVKQLIEVLNANEFVSKLPRN